jgi:hypothetical protein
MGHWAKIENNIVTNVIVSDENFIKSLNGEWIQTSYNTKGGVHLNGETPLRKNYAGIGYIYDRVRDAFYAQQPYPSWTLNEDTCIWDSPVPHPMDGNSYQWNEEELNWILID